MNAKVKNQSQLVAVNTADDTHPAEALAELEPNYSE